MEIRERVLVHTKHTKIDFLRGKASKIFDNVMVIYKNCMPHTVGISYIRYYKLKNSGEDI